jgi:hypothetical protein
LHESGGVAKAFFFLKDVVLAPGNPPLKFLKVGDKGKNVRSYTSCCGTGFNTAGGASFPIKGGRPFSRNNIYNSDGSRYSCEPCANIMLDSAFDDYAHPVDNGVAGDDTTQHDTAGAAFGGAMKATAGDDTTQHDRGYYKTPDLDVESVPITWPKKPKQKL